jgi:hypothetical protein
LIEARYNEDMIYYRNSEPSNSGPQNNTKEREVGLGFGKVKNIDHCMEETPTFSRFSGDSINFDQSNAKDNAQNLNSLAYFTVTGHPLNDVKVLGLRGTDKRPQSQDQDSSMIGTRKQLLYCSPLTPFVVLHDPSSKQLEFGIIKKS